MPIAPQWPQAERHRQDAEQHRGGAAQRPGGVFRPAAIAVLSAWDGTSSVKYAMFWSGGEAGTGCSLTLSSPPGPGLLDPVPLARLRLAPYRIPQRGGDI